MKFNRKFITVTVVRISKPELTPNARNLLSAQKYAHYHDYKYASKDTQEKIKHANREIIKRLSGFAGEHSIGLQVVNGNGEPFWVNSYSNQRYSDKRGVSNLPQWIIHNIKPNQLVRLKLVRTRSGYLLTNISNASKLVPRFLQAQCSKKPAK